MIRIRGLCLAAALVAPVAVPAQQTDAASFYLVLRTDTILVERQARTASRLDGEFLDRTRGAHVAFGAALAADGLVTRLETSVTTGTGDTTSRGQVVSFSGDSARLDSGRGAQTVGSPAGALPYINPSPSFMEQMLIRARVLGTPSASIPVFAPGAPAVAATVRWVGSDSATITVGAATIRLAVSPTGRLLGGLIPAQGIRILRGAAIGPLRRERPDYSAPPGAPYTAEDVVFKSPAGITLAGTLTIPKNHDRRVPAVVTLTGSGQQDRDESLLGISGYKPFRLVADTLGRRGIAVLRIDDRGVGGSSGNPQTETSADYADDIRAAVAYLRTRPEIDPSRIGLVGHSEGGIVAPMVAATDSTLRAIVLMAGTSRTGRRVLEYQYGRQLDRATLSATARDSLRRRIPAQLDSTTIPWMRFFLDYDPAATARRVRTPVLILQGGHDIQVTPDQAPELATAFRAGGNTRVTVRTFPLLNHLFLVDTKGETDYAALPSKLVAPEVLGAIADWLTMEFK